MLFCLQHYCSHARGHNLDSHKNAPELGFSLSQFPRMPW